MNEENYCCLLDRLRTCGFADKLQEPLKRGMQKGLPLFSLDDQLQIGTRKLFVTAQVQKWRDCEMYYCWKFRAALQPSNFREMIMSRDFYFGRREPLVGLRDAFLLLKGGAIQRKELLIGHDILPDGWAWLDFQRTDACGNFRWAYARHLSSRMLSKQNEIA